MKRRTVSHPGSPVSRRSTELEEDDEEVARGLDAKGAEGEGAG